MEFSQGLLSINYSEYCISAYIIFLKGKFLLCAPYIYLHCKISSGKTKIRFISTRMQKSQFYICWPPNWHWPSAGTGSPSAGTGTCMSPCWHCANMGRPVLKLGARQRWSARTGHLVLELGAQCWNWSTML